MDRNRSKGDDGAPSTDLAPDPLKAKVAQLLKLLVLATQLKAPILQWLVAIAEEHSEKISDELRGILDGAVDQAFADSPFLSDASGKQDGAKALQKRLSRCQNVDAQTTEVPVWQLLGL